MVGERHNHIVRSTSSDGIVQAEFGNRPVLERADAVFEMLEAVESSAVSLLALPERGAAHRGNHAHVSWYSDIAAAAMPIDRLSGQEYERAAATIRATILSILTRGSSTDQQLIAVALNVLSRDSILVADGQPVFVDWGMVPANAASSLEAYEAHVSSTLGEFLPEGFSPRLEGPAGREAPSAAMAVPVVAAAAETPVLPKEDRASASAQEDNVAATVAQEAGPPAATARSSIAAMALPLSLALALLLFLAYILWPGNLVYPPHSTLLGSEEQTIGFQRQHNDALREEIRTLQVALADVVCTADMVAAPDDTALFDPGSTPSTVPQVPAVEEQALIPDTVIPGSAPTAVPPASAGDADAGDAGDAVARLQSRELLDLLDKTTVLVVGATSSGVTTGSGVFVTDRHVLTNRHVVDGATGRITVSNGTMARPLDARIIASSTNSDFGSRDFALLEIVEATSIDPMPLTDQIERLDEVVAAGFPSFVVATDPEFIASIRDGNTDRLTSVQMAVTEGIVTQKQPRNGNLVIVGHTATISSGNSGGPLADKCGRIVAINTFTRTDSENALRLNLALGAGDANAFLAEHGIERPLSAGDCVEATAIAVPPPQPDAATEAEARLREAGTQGPPGDASAAPIASPPVAPGGADQSANPATLDRDAEADALMPPPEGDQ